VDYLSTSSVLNPYNFISIFGAQKNGMQTFTSRSIKFFSKKNGKPVSRVL